MKQQELLTIQTNVNETNPNNSNSTREEEPLVIHEQLETTPLWIHKHEKEGWFATFEKYKISENFKTKQELIDNLFQEQFNTMTKIMLCIIDIKQKTQQN